tara:strand:- start:547 stop:693 length:147 start_codon:yes stop_codon:yes gene_type:complete
VYIVLLEKSFSTIKMVHLKESQFGFSVKNERSSLLDGNLLFGGSNGYT